MKNTKKLFLMIILFLLQLTVYGQGVALGKIVEIKKTQPRTFTIAQGILDREGFAHYPIDTFLLKTSQVIRKSLSDSINHLYLIGQSNPSVPIFVLYKKDTNGFIIVGYLSNTEAKKHIKFASDVFPPDSMKLNPPPKLPPDND